MDPFSRYDKRCIDCHFTVQCGKQLEGRYQNPIIVVSLSCGNNSNGLITHDELTTLFHEMGHAIHSILARTRYQVFLTNMVQGRFKTASSQFQSKVPNLFLSKSTISRQMRGQLAFFELFPV